jgi:Lecithin retinol acyltransferase
MAVRIEHGAHLVADRTFYTHHGIYLGGGEVVHFAPDDGGQWRKKSVRRTSFREFWRGAKLIYVRQYREDGNLLSKEQTCDRAEKIAKASREGKFKEYDLLESNCEHLATYCKIGVSRSRQIEERERALRYRRLNNAMKKGEVGRFTGFLAFIADVLINDSDEISHGPAFNDLIVEQEEIDRILRKC